MPEKPLVRAHTELTEYDIFLFRSGKHYRLHEKLGCHLTSVDGIKGAYFAVFAPAALSVHVVGTFNDWALTHELLVRWDESGIWEGFIIGVKIDDLYKFAITSEHAEDVLEKADPFARRAERPPNFASIVYNSHHVWHDKKWIEERKTTQAPDAPLSVYEIHVGSWKWHSTENRPLNYREIAHELVDYLRLMRFTHVELMPIMEFPYDPSWGYQITGYFAPTSRFGSPDDFKYFVDTLHQAGIGVLLDWVPSHFPEDGHGLAKFDGSCVYEHPDRRKGYHPDWRSLIFNYGRNEIVSFLISNAMYWIREYRIDGLRVDAVASMLYLDYSRNDGEWEPNEHGGRENLDAIRFIQSFNTAIKQEFPDVLTIAEESTSYPGVTHPIEQGGLGFDLKWMMGWMHDTLKYFKEDPLYRIHHHSTITFSPYYAFSEKFMLPLSHDEVVHGKFSLLGRMPGDEWLRFANLRAMYAYMFAHPGSKLIFMGGEFAQYIEWNFSQALDWNLLEYPIHNGIQHLISALNTVYREQKALHENNYRAEGFKWVDFTDATNSVITFLRAGTKPSDICLIICNLVPLVHESYRIGVPINKRWKVILNSDETIYGGSGQTIPSQYKPVKSTEEIHGYKQYIELSLPPMSVLYLSS